MIAKKYSLRLFSTIFTPLNIEFSELASSTDLSEKIEEAFGPSGNGILTVSGIENYPENRLNLLNLSRNLALLPKPELEKLELPDFHYSVGWSHGKEKLGDIFDFSKGSFYANPLIDTPEEFHEGVCSNIWPTFSLPDLEPAFKILGSEMVEVGRLLCKHIDQYLEKVLPNKTKKPMQSMINEFNTHVGRLLYYYPEVGDSKNWAAWHNDHSALTALTPSLYFDESTGETVAISEIMDEESGLFIKKKDGKNVKAVADKDSLIFEIGETSEIISGGKLQATPHAVFSKKGVKNLSRSSFAVFMAPGPNFVLECPDEEGIFIEHEEVPSLKARWVYGSTFGDFHKRTMAFFNY